MRRGWLRAGALYLLPVSASALALAPRHRLLHRHLHMTASPATRSAADPTSPPVAAPPYAYAYCHGFLSYPRSTKGVHVRKELQHLADIELLDLNLPDGSGVVTYASGLAAIERFLEQQRLLHGHGVKLRLIGSSLGGYIVARFAELHPEAVDRIFMLCPAFSIGERASKFLPPEEMAEWERDGVRGLQRVDGFIVNMPYAFVAESALLPPYPAYQCPAVILHGLEDEVVPVQTTQGLMTDGTQQADLTRAVFVHDKHGLDTPATLALLPPLISEFFQLEEGSGGSSAAIEVEKKYAVADAQEVEKKLLRQEDVQKVMEMMFIDSYWDSADNSLARQDSWLRLRAGLWELKTPIPASASGAGTAVYREATALEDVTATLRRVCPQAFLDLPPAATSTSQRLKGALQERGWAPFVTFGTKRRKYRCQGFTIDTDEASYGHAVLEVEAMCTTSSEVGAAESAIEQMAHALGLAAAGKARGKVEEYLLRYQPEKLGVIKAARQALREGK